MTAKRLKSKQRNARVWQRRRQCDECEPRLVLSAQPIGDIEHHALEAPVWDAVHDVGIGWLQPTDSNLDQETIETHLAEAHRATGWTPAHQAFGLNGDQQTVAIIDSGIAWDHVALGKGFGAGYRVVGGWDFAENDARPYDDGPAGFHGTHVAGIVGSNDGVRQGVAPNVDLVSLRVFDDNGRGQMAWVEQALQWVHTNRNAFENPITTVNLSLGSTWNSDTIPSWATFEDELRQLYEDGIVVVASAGNSFAQYNAPGLSYPAASPYVIPVASIDDNGLLSNFSQRDDHVIAAPGRNIESTVPDHVFGSDGKYNDWASASGTSMAAPYVSGAAVLVREAMQLSGWTDINAASIFKVLTDTSDSIWDSITSQAYHKLNLQRALDAILPDDQIGGSWADATTIGLQSGATTEGWINTLGDTDAYRFTADRDGRVIVRLDGLGGDDVRWNLWTAGALSDAGQAREVAWDVRAGQTYAIGLQDNNGIGAFSLRWQFDAVAGSPSPGPIGEDNPSISQAQHLGRVEHLSLGIAAGGGYSAQATRDGIMSVVFRSETAISGGLQVRDAQGNWHTDTTWEDGRYQIHLDVKSDQSVQIALPGNSGSQGILEVVNVLQKAGNTLTVAGTEGGIGYDVDLRNGVDLRIGAASYHYAADEIKSMVIETGAGHDTVVVHGSGAAEKIEIRPGQTILDRTGFSLQLSQAEQVAFIGGGGGDRVFFYGADTDDTLLARSNNAEMVGANYRFNADGFERLTVQAGGGNDRAILFDSAGNDTLVVKPQYTSLRGSNYLNYANGFESISVYATGGGHDAAQIYDSNNSDQVIIAGDKVTLDGPGYRVETRLFDQLDVYSRSGGRDSVWVYSSSGNTLQRGSGVISLREAGVESNARGFQDIQAFIADTSVPLSQIAIKSLSIGDLLHDKIDISTVFVSQVLAAPLDHNQSAEAGPMDSPAVDLSNALGGSSVLSDRAAESTSMSMFGLSSEQNFHARWNPLDHTGNVDHGWHADTIEVASVPDFDLMQVYRDANHETDESTQALLKYLDDEDERQTLCHDLIAHADEDWEDGLRDQVFADL